MYGPRRPARINVKALIILISVTFLLGAGALVGHYVRKRFMANEALETGLAAYEGQKWKQACRNLKRYLLQYPDDIPILEQYAIASLAIRPRNANTVGVAIGAYRRLLRHKQGDAAICSKLATLYFGGRDYANAAYVCEERLKVDDTDGDALIWLGRSLAAQQKGKEAKAVLERLVRLHPDRVKAYALLASIEVKQSSAAGVLRAGQWMTHAVDANPQSAEALGRRARFYRVLARDWTAARADLEAAASVLDDDPRVDLLLADEWIELEGFEEATVYLKRVDRVDLETLLRLEIDPDVLSFAKLNTSSNVLLNDPDAQGHAALAARALDELQGGYRVRFLPVATELYLEENNIAGAEKCLAEYGDAIKAHATQAQRNEAFVVLQARLAFAKKQPYDALNFLAGSGGIGPRSGDALRFVAQLFEQTGQSGRAREVLLKLVEQMPQDRQAWIQLAQRFRGSDWDRAYSASGSAFRLRPTVGAKLLLLEAKFMRVIGERDFDLVADEVYAELKSLREQFPRNAGIRVLLAVVDTERGQVDQAVKGIEDALIDCDETGSAELMLVDLYVRHGLATKAQVLCQSMVERMPDRAAPRLRLAQLHLKASRPTEAREVYRRAVEELSGDQQLMVARTYAGYLLTQKERESAIAVLFQMVGIHGNSVDIPLILLSIPEVRSDPEEAQRLVDKVRAIEGQSGVRWKLFQAGLWLETEQWRAQERQTRELLEECVLADPMWEEPAVILGNLHQGLGEFREAEKVYRSALAHKRGAFAVADRLVGLLKREGRYVEAQEVLDAMPLASAALAAHRIDLAIGRGEYEDAIQGLEVFVATHPGDVAARIRFARLTYVVKRDHERALQLLDEASELSPDSVDVLFAKISILQAQGRRNDAISLLNSEVDRLQNFAIYWLRATYYTAVGEYELAEKDYVHLITFEDSIPAAYGLLGHFYHKRGRTASAIAMWEEGMRHDPQNVTLRRALTKGLLVSDDPALRERGKGMLVELQDTLPDDPDLLYVEASLLFEERTAESRVQITECLERAVSLNPSYVSSHLVLIRLAREDGDFARARKLVSRALAGNPTNQVLRIAQITVELDFRNVGVARELARGMLDDRRNNLAVCNQLSDAFRKANQNQDALEFNNEAIRIAPEDPFANVTRAALLVAEGKKQEATRHLDAYVQTETGRGNVSALLALASQHTDQADFASADKVLQQALDLAPDGIGIMVERLHWFGAQNRFDDIMTMLAKTPEDSRQHLPVLMAGANLLSLAGRDRYLKEARHSFARIREMDSTNIPACFGFAEATSQLGDVDGAISALRHVIRLDPANRGGLNNLAWMLATKKGTSGLTEAEELIGQALQHYPNDAHLLDTSGVVFLKLGRLSEAKQRFEKCLALVKNEPITRAKALLRLAEVLIGLDVDAQLIRTRLNEAQQLHEKHKIFSTEEQSKLSKLLKSI